MTRAQDVLAKLWGELGHDRDALTNVELTGSELVLPSSFAVARR